MSQESSVQWPQGKNPVGWKTKNGDLDLTRRSGEMRSANLARKRRDRGVRSAPDIKGCSLRDALAARHFSDFRSVTRCAITRLPSWSRAPFPFHRLSCFLRSLIQKSSSYRKGDVLTKIHALGEFVKPAFSDSALLSKDFWLNPMLGLQYRRFRSAIMFMDDGGVEFGVRYRICRVPTHSTLENGSLSPLPIWAPFGKSRCGDNNGDMASKALWASVTPVVLLYNRRLYLNPIV